MKKEEIALSIFIKVMDKEPNPVENENLMTNRHFDPVKCARFFNQILKHLEIPTDFEP